MYLDLVTFLSVMAQLGTPESFYFTLALVLARIAILVIISCFLALLGVMAMDFLTPVHGQRHTGESAIGTAWFAAGSFILIGLVVHAAATAPGVLGGPVGTFLADPRRLSLIAASFLVSLFLLLVLFLILDKLTPNISLVRIEDNPEAAGVYVFGYLVSFGLILHAAMKLPL